MKAVRKKYMPRRQRNNPDMGISTRLDRVLLQLILASYSGFSLPLYSPLCLVSEKPDYFAKMSFATHPNARFGFNGQQGLSGIQVQDVNYIDVGLGGQCMSNNEFSYLKFGVRGCNIGNMEIENSRFYQVGTPDGSTPGTAVSFGCPNDAASFLSQKGLGASSATTFEDLDVAMLVVNADVITSDNLIRNVFNGIQWEYTNARYASIRNNNIDDYEGIGITAFFNSPLDLLVESNLLVNKDNVANTGIFDIGILLSGNGVVNNGQDLVVRYNTLRNEKTLAGQPYWGIYSGFNDRGRYWRNTVHDYSAGLSPSVSMRFLGCQRGLVTDNNITSNVTQPLSIPGLYGGYVFNVSPFMTVGCNKADGTLDGLQYYEDCDHGDIYENTMRNHQDGLHYSSPMTITDIQDNKGNLWPGMTSAIEAHWPSPAPGFLSLSRYFVSATPPTDLWPDPLSPMGGWFFNFGSPGLVRCLTGGGGGESESMPEFTEQESRLSAADIALLEETMEVPNGQEGRLFEYKSRLFRHLLIHPELLNEHPLAGDFFVAQENTTLGKLVRAELGMEPVIGVDPATMTQLKVLRAELQSGIQDVRELQDSMALENDFEKRRLWIDPIKIASAANKGYSDAINQIRSEILDSQIKEAEALEESLQALTPDKSYELDLQTVLLILVNDKLQGGKQQWSAADIEALNAIAPKCPHTDGRAVYYARHMLRADKTWLTWQDDPWCGAMGEAQARDADRLPVSAGAWTMYPSPANDFVWLQNAEGLSADYTIVNAVGTAVMQGSLHTGLPLQVAHLPSGPYWIQVREQATHIVQVLPMHISR
jgi:hypothetical protein